MTEHPEPGGDPGDRPPGDDLLAVDRDRSLVRLQDAGENLQQRRLAGAVLPEESMHLAGLYRQ